MAITVSISIRVNALEENFIYKNVKNYFFEGENMVCGCTFMELEVYFSKYGIIQVDGTKCIVFSFERNDQIQRIYIHL